MAQSLYLREQTECCRCLARDSLDAVLRDSLLSLAQEYAARADAGENDGTAVWQAGPDDKGAD
jgi:hypothetical protein